LAGVFVNAQIHHTAPVRGIGDLVIYGRYLFAATYSPDLKLVEGLFAITYEVGKMNPWQILPES
jgi:transposase